MVPADADSSGNSAYMLEVGPPANCCVTYRQRDYPLSPLELPPKKPPQSRTLVPEAPGRNERVGMVNNSERKYS